MTNPMSNILASLSHLMRDLINIISISALLLVLGHSLPLSAGDSASSYFIKGLNMALEKKYDAALDQYRKGHDVQPVKDDMPRFANKEAKRLHHKGVLLVFSDPQKAMTYFMKADQLDENNPTILNDLSVASFKMGNLKHGLEYAHRALRVEPTHMTVIANLGYYLTKLDRHEDAYFWNRLHLVLETEKSSIEITKRNLQLNMTNLGLSD